MIEQIFEKKPKRRVKDLNIVPILDMLTTVIFFLLMSTSFMEYTKLTVPPSRTTVASEATAAPPLAPKLLLTGPEQSLRLQLVWGGKAPGEKNERIREADPAARRTGLLQASQKLAQDFAAAYPGEKTIQLALGSKLPYQDLISVMDGVRESLPDVVLISPAEAEARSAASPAGGES